MGYNPDRVIKKKMTYLLVAKLISELGTCKRLKVGAIILRKDGSVASTGYNGAPPGMDHCTDETCNSNQRCIHTIHAEENALRFATGELFSAYLTHEPCLNCTRDMAMRGVRNIYYDLPYNSMPEAEKKERAAIIGHYQMMLIKLER